MGYIYNAKLTNNSAGIFFQIIEQMNDRNHTVKN